METLHCRHFSGRLFLLGFLHNSCISPHTVGLFLHLWMSLGCFLGIPQHGYRAFNPLERRRSFPPCLSKHLPYATQRFCFPKQSKRDKSWVPTLDIPSYQVTWNLPPPCHSSTFNLLLCPPWQGEGPSWWKAFSGILVFRGDYINAWETLQWVGWAFIPRTEEISSLIRALPWKSLSQRP